MIDDDMPPIDDDVPPLAPPAAMICKDCGDLRETTDGIIVVFCEHFQTGAYFSPTARALAAVLTNHTRKV